MPQRGPPERLVRRSRSRRPGVRRSSRSATARSSAVPSSTSRSPRRGRPFPAALGTPVALPVPAVGVLGRPAGRGRRALPRDDHASVHRAARPRPDRTRQRALTHAALVAAHGSSPSSPPTGGSLASPTTATAGWSASTTPSRRRPTRSTTTGRILSITDADGVRTVAMIYDDAGRVVEQVTAAGFMTRFGYDPPRRTTLADRDHNPLSVYTHDEHGRVEMYATGGGSASRDASTPSVGSCPSATLMGRASPAPSRYRRSPPRRGDRLVARAPSTATPTTTSIASSSQSSPDRTHVVRVRRRAPCSRRASSPRATRASPSIWRWQHGAPSPPRRWRRRRRHLRRSPRRDDRCCRQRLRRDDALSTCIRRAP